VSARHEPAPVPAACLACARRSWLLSELTGPLEYCARDRTRLFELLALGDRELLKALAGRRAAELSARYVAFPAGETERPPDVERICRHCAGYPRGLGGRHGPHMLEVLGGSRRLVELAGGPSVAILGSAAASDYGLASARSLARGLGASGVTVIAGLTDGIAVAAHMGALDADGASVAVMGGGLDVACPARRRSLYGRVRERGCAVSELPLGCRGRRWGQLASERIVVELASVTVLVEAEDTPAALAGARLAHARGRTLAAIPGRICSPLSRGTNAMLMQGASLVRGARDVLELLGPLGASGSAPASAPAGLAGLASNPLAGLPAGLRATLERVGAGCDTPDRLARAGEDPAAALLALTELELLGLVIRGDGGRYVPCEPLTGM
jgi:DNA processing protein